MPRLRESDDLYVPGGYWVIDDRTGFRVRASEARKEWTGLLVDGVDEYEDRHPQDFVRARTDRQNVKNPRPPPPDVYGGPLFTLVAATAAAGATSIEVASSAEFETGDLVAIFLDNGETTRVTLTSIPDTTHIAFTGNPLPWSTSADMQATNYSRTPVPDL